MILNLSLTTSLLSHNHRVVFVASKLLRSLLNLPNTFGLKINLKLWNIKTNKFKIIVRVLIMVYMSNTLLVHLNSKRLIKHVDRKPYLILFVTVWWRHLSIALFLQLSQSLAKKPNRIGK